MNSRKRSESSNAMLRDKRKEIGETYDQLAAKALPIRETCCWSQALWLLWRKQTVSNPIETRAHHHKICKLSCFQYSFHQPEENCCQPVRISYSTSCFVALHALDPLMIQISHTQSACESTVATPLLKMIGLSLSLEG